MASGQSVFKGALGWDDWIWWVAIGAVALLILLLLVCCCVCMQRAKRKGHEEALAAVQARQRLTQEREVQEQQQQQQRYQQATFANNPTPSGYQPPGYAYSKPVAVPLAPPPNRKNLGPQVAANGYASSSDGLHSNHNQQFAKAYPPLPGQPAGQNPGQGRQSPAPQPAYTAPNKWYTPGHQSAQSRSPLSQGYESNAPRLSNQGSSSVGYDHHTSSQYPDSMRYEDPYPEGGGPDGVPFMSVTSPSASKSLKQNRKHGVKLQNTSAPNSEHEQIPAPVVVPRYARAPPSPSEARASVGSGSGASGGTLQARIDALRSADTNDMVHSRISIPPSSETGSEGGLSTLQMPRTLQTQESYASTPARRSGLLVGSVLSPNSSALSSKISLGDDDLESGRSYETFDPSTFNSAKSSEVSAQLVKKTSSQSIGSDFSHGQFEDAEHFGDSGHKFTRHDSGKIVTPGKPSRGDNLSFNSRDSVEF
ncbi:hypothetical protein PHYBOEH_000444 [Phytophthora boehmeriae]|uniref:Uncharacterized protein n=1 Tax=Phytophthora boehmeriae TaxID=109152 RepID=A0A8T1X0Q3_9STRA|nr:hypothetical protein PHYBOEH_000444 [Phytophthora boehmeriae]